MYQHPIGPRPHTDDPKVLAIRALRIAYAAWEGLARRPRSPRAWMYASMALRDAREDAVAAGIFDRQSQSFISVTDRYADATRRWRFGEVMAAQGRPTLV